MFRRTLRTATLLVLVGYLLVRLGNFAPNVVAERLQFSLDATPVICQIQPDLKILFSKLQQGLDVDQALCRVVLVVPGTPLALPLKTTASKKVPQGAVQEIFIPPEEFAA